MTGVERTYTGQRADRFLVTDPDGRVRVDFAALDNFLAEIVAVELAKRYRQIAEACQQAADQAGGRARAEKATAGAYRHLGQQAETIGEAEAERAGWRRERGERLRPRVVPEEAVDLLCTAAERLRHAGGVHHVVPVRLAQAAGWFQIAAELHAGDTGCHWCATGHCPAIEAARLLCGEPVGHIDTQHRERG